ncbi:hypothetical protein T10_11109 [Trichinella papuae]|uniref:Uncharacterized protein n=1 Tax=Trichinella papuae TaxID=268474 RepID=A0A0V1N366_9BILA|nr:hypothetical protein T10_11109 [Trichinella papuae]
MLYHWLSVMLFGWLNIFCLLNVKVLITESSLFKHSLGYDFVAVSSVVYIKLKYIPMSIKSMIDY